MSQATRQYILALNSLLAGRHYDKNDYATYEKALDRLKIELSRQGLDTLAISRKLLSLNNVRL